MAGVAITEDEASANQAMISNEEYKIWKKNSPFLYDMVITHALEWPTLTLQWFPDKEVVADKGYMRHRLLLGTHTSAQDQNYLQIATVSLPNADGDAAPALGDGKLDLKDYDEEKGEIGAYASTSTRLQITQRINHDGEVNRARYCPQNCDLIATRAVSGLTYVFDRTKHSNQPDPDGQCRPDIVLRGQTKEGYGLAWNPVRQGPILAASEDTTVCLWDISAYQKDSRTLDPLHTYRGHTAVVEDVAWHNHLETLFASVGDDRQMLLWDTRESPDSPKHRVEAHTAEINAVQFSPASEYIVATGSSDHTVALWDLRNLSVRLHTLEAHTDEVLQLAWSPHHETVLCSASADRRVNVWDLSRIGEEQTAEDAEDGPAELLFVHGGHTSRPTDLSWSPQDEWKVATAAEDNIVMVWQAAQSIVQPVETEPDAADLE
ncbi:Histone acetyltransferase type B subunit 2 [Malassezia sp. CBS 17886]|nr:Histone acetyltransferase type B subunit 2 [Malassezia sp. CBS 17886]